MTPFPTRPLGSSGVRFGTLGLGCATIGGLHGPVSAAEARDTLAAARECGIASFDVAPLYGAGEGERRVGAFLASCDTPDMVVSTKTGWLVATTDGTARVRSDYSYRGTIESLEASLDRLGLAHLDAVFIHDLDRSNHGEAIGQRFEEAMDGAYIALDEWRRAGRVGAVGIGVNDPAICVAALDRGRFDAFLIAGRYTLLDQGALSELLPLCGRRGVSVISGAPLNTGILAKGAVTGASYAHRPASAEVLARVEAMGVVATRHGVTLLAAALQFPLGHESVAAVLPGPRSARQVAEIAAAMQAPIPPGFWRDLKRQGLLAEDVAVPDDARVPA